MQVVTFSAQALSGGTVFPLVSAGRGKVDHLRTIEGLRKLREPVPILFEEKYLQERDGLGLLLRLRLEVGMPASRFPVYVRLRSPLEVHLRHHPKYAVLCRPGVAILSEGEEPADVPTPATLDGPGLLRVLKSLPFRHEGDGSRHDMANRWGPLRLWMGAQLVRPPGERSPRPGWVESLERELRGEEPYAYLLALAELGAAGPDGSDGVEPRSWEDWCQFVRAYDGKEPFRILLLDDEIGRGWGEAVRSLLGWPGRVEVDTTLGGVDFDTERGRVRDHALSGRWDLVLSDLRMFAEDRDGAATPSSLGLGGAALIGEIKARSPQTAVVAFTASNKAWSVRELQSLGADGYWSKESPEFGANQTVTTENAALLLDTVGDILYKRSEARPVWNLLRNIEAESKRAEYVDGWAREGRETTRAVKARLRSICHRLRRAYGFLVARASKHEQEQFRLRPHDLAYLTLWSVINEVSSLYLTQRRSGRAPALYLQHDLTEWEEVEFFVRDPLSGKGRMYWHVRNGEVVHGPSQVPRGQILRSLCPVRKDETTKLSRPTFPGGDADTRAVEWLLGMLGAREILQRFKVGEPRGGVGRPGLRFLRNNLEEAHGRTGKAWHASPQDIHDLCALWTALLVDPYRSGQ